MRCFVCGEEVERMRALCDHLLVTKDKEGHIHVHGDLQKAAVMKELLGAASEETGVHLQKTVLEKKEIVFHNRQRIGDMIMFTAGVRDFKRAFPDVRVNVVSIAGHIWDHNPNIDRSLVPTKENTLMIGPGKLTNSSNRLDWHFSNAFRVSMEDALGVHIPQGESWGDIYFTEEEYNAPRVTEKPYWIICIGGEKGWGCKMYPFERWQKFVDQNPDVLFYQIGAKEDQHPVLKGPNVVNYIGMTQSKETGIRDLFKLFLNAEGSIGLVSFHMHLSGTLGKPCIVVAGAREPVSFTQYPGHRYLATDGSLPCGITACWKCNIDACKDLRIVGGEKTPRCVDLIQPEDLTRALNLYYEGGRCKKDVASPKIKFKNVVPTPPKPVILPEPPKVDTSRFGMSFGGGSLTEKDWAYMQEVVKRHNVKTVLEFGAGLSTLLMNELGLHVITYETDQRWIDRIKKINSACDIRPWDGKGLDINPEHPENKYDFDLVFVDGPAGGRNREISTRFAAGSSDIVIIHDANREHERLWQEKYLKGGFTGPEKGGNRCHLWLKAKSGVDPLKTAAPGPVLTVEIPRSVGFLTSNTPEATTGPASPKTGKFIKVVSTARGWGGCARSVTTIMKMLLKLGHIVEFIPFRNKVGSREYQECIKNELPGLIVTENYDTIRESCDALFMYADDYVWEFGQQELVDVFSGIGAERKIMMINYRRGDVGKIPWTRDWDKYMFLNSTQEKELLKVCPGVKTVVLPPCTELEEFFKVQPDYNHSIRVVRHSSQGDTKFYPDFSTAIGAVLASRPDVEISMLPGPSFVQPCDRFRKLPRTASAAEIASFLASGNLFWYSLPPGYMDMGPRVILEAMAAGLPVLADNWGGALDRVTPECGWLCDAKDKHVDIIKHVSFAELEKKGDAARERARREFVPERYMDEILT